MPDVCSMKRSRVRATAVDRKKRKQSFLTGQDSISDMEELLEGSCMMDLGLTSSRTCASNRRQRKSPPKDT